jgi:uncharacterized membrane protein YbjE (DUF340 family)
VLVDDLYLYAAFAAGWAVGRLWPSRHPWLARATLGTVAVLLFLLGASFRAISPGAIESVLPLAAAFAGVVLVVTAGLAVALRRLRSRASTPAAGRPARVRAGVPSSLLLVLALFVGYGVGRAVALPTATLLTIALAALLALVGYGVDLSLESVRHAWSPLLAATLGAVVTASVFVVLVRVDPRASFATGLGFGWYSLAGPLVAARLGATLGLFTFVANLLRELSVMLLAPYVGPRLGGEALSAMGGATSMDTNLYFITRYGEPGSAALALATGLTLTLAASLLVPAVLAL